MYENFETLAKAALLFAAVSLVTAIGFAVTRSFRGCKTDDRQRSTELMSKFRELHAEGGLSDEEFRTIKTKIASELKAELNDNSSRG